VVLKIDQREYTPTVIDQIVFAGGSHRSAQKAARALFKLARLKISGMQVLRITEQIGNELLVQREHDAALQQHRELKSTNGTPVEIACVEVDGGRMQTRAAGEGPGVHDCGWKETKVAALWKMTGPTFETDPHPGHPLGPAALFSRSRSRPADGSRDQAATQRVPRTGRIPRENRPKTATGCVGQ
jgi:hypothetical protein